jgi:hypothetical protein
MTYEQLKNLKTEEFKRFCGVHLETFTRMVEELEPDLERTGKRGSSHILPQVTLMSIP